MDKKICDVCGTPLNLTKGNIYLVKDEKMTGKHVLYDAVDDGSWLEITKEHLEECFELMEVE